MNPREKILAGVIGGLVGLAVIGLGVRAFVLKPLAELDKKTFAMREKLEKAKAERRAFFAAEEQVNAFAARTFSETVDKASAASAEMVTRQILSAGLPEAEFSRLPAGPRKLRGAQEIGWSIQGDGHLQQVINLIFLLQSEPHLSRVDGLVVTGGDKPGMVQVRFKYLTLVVDPAPLDVKFTNLVASLTLDSAERRLLDTIASRDILRPYIKRPPTPTPNLRSGSAPPSTAPTVAPGPEALKVVSLSDWQGAVEVHVRDLINQRTSVHRPGDPLAGGVIVMVDYRPLPLPGKPGLQSFSRVILKSGQEYWALERGSTLDQKYKMAPENLPKDLAAVAERK